MPSIRQRVADALLGHERQRLLESIDILEDAYFQGKYAFPPDRLAQGLEESASSYMIDFVTRLQTDYEPIAGFGEKTESERLYVVQESRRLWRRDVVTQWAVWLWTNYGFGEKIVIVPKDPEAEEIWKAFWTADENSIVLAADGLQQLSYDVLVDGELFLAFFISTVDGTCQVRVIKSDQIKKVVTDPEDENVPLYYKREWSDEDGSVKPLYYADWQALRNGWTARAKLEGDVGRAEDMKSSTTVCVLHIAHNRKAGLRGWPIFCAGVPWTKAHTRFREDRSTVAATVAMFVNKLKVKGGSRPIDNLRARLESTWTSGNPETNPAAAAGSMWLENQAGELERMPLMTGASDAKIDGESLLQMAALGAGVYPHYMGSGDAYRLATATSMEGPVLRQWSRYQTFWAAQFRRMVRIVLWAAATYSQANELQTGAPDKFVDVEVTVSTDKLVEVDLEVISQAMSAMLRDGLLPYVQMGMIDTEMAQGILSSVWRMVLEALGISDVVDIIPAEVESGESIQQSPTVGELRAANSLIGVMKGWDARMEVLEAELREAHVAPEEVNIVCPFPDCEGQIAYRYPGHPSNLLVCAECERTFNSDLEQRGG